MAKFTEVSPTAGLSLKWHDFLCWTFTSQSKDSLEVKLANFIGTDYAQIECSGTAALVVALEALKCLSDKKQVVISAYTCPWVAVAVVHCGLIPVLADSQSEHFNFCPDALKKACSQETLAVVHTHLAGRTADIGPTMMIAKDVGAYVIEDAAQALGASLKGRSVGLHGDIGFYSLGVGKGLTIFAGGVLLSENLIIREAMQQVSRQLKLNLRLELRRVIELLAYGLLYRPIAMGLVFGNNLRKQLKRGDLITAVGDDCAFNFPVSKVGRWRKQIGAKAIERLPDFIAQTRQQALSRVALLDNITGIHVIKDANESSGVWPFMIVMLPTEAARDAVLAKLWDKGLGVGRLFIHALMDYDYLAAYFQKANTPNARDFAARQLIISNSLWLSDAEFLTIKEVLTEHAVNV